MLSCSALGVKEWNIDGGDGLGLDLLILVAFSNLSDFTSYKETTECPSPYLTNQFTTALRFPKYLPEHFLIEIILPQFSSSSFQWCPP